MTVGYAACRADQARLFDAPFLGDNFLDIIQVQLRQDGA